MERRTPPLPALLRRIAGECKNPTLAAHCLPSLLGIHELRTVVVHRAPDVLGVDQRRLSNLLEAATGFARACGISPSVQLAVTVGSSFQILIDSRLPWGPAAYSRRNTRAIINGSKRRRMVAGWIRGSLQWPLITCSLCGRLSIPECLRTTQNEISFREKSEPLMVYCDFHCGLIHQRNLRSIRDSGGRFDAGEYCLQPFLELFLPHPLPEYLYDYRKGYGRRRPARSGAAAAEAAR